MWEMGDGRGTDRVEQAIQSTRTHPVLSVDYDGAKGGLIQVVGGSNLTIREATLIGEGVTEGVAGNANVIFGARMIPEMKDEIRVMSVVTGVKAKFGERVRNEEKVAALNLETIGRLY